jgi:hypothetical protein
MLGAVPGVKSTDVVYDDGPEVFHFTKTMLLSGRSLTWYGPSLVDAHTELSEQLG